MSRVRTVDDAHTEGRCRLLSAIADAPSLRELARRLGVSRSALSRWSTGDARPDYCARAVLHAELGIDPDAWERRPPALSPPRDTFSGRLGTP